MKEISVIQMRLDYLFLLIPVSLTPFFLGSNNFLQYSGTNAIKWIQLSALSLAAEQ